jgi:hypothetical protein
MLTALKYSVGGVLALTMLSGLIWFASTHWVICLLAIFCYVVYEITMGGEKEL